MRSLDQYRAAGPGYSFRSHDYSPYVWADALFGDPANTITVFG